MQLRNTKTSDNKSTLIHYLADIAEQRMPELFKLKEELASTTDAAKGNPELARRVIILFL